MATEDPFRRPPGSVRLVQVRLLGPLEIEGEDGPLPISGSKLRAVLAMLALDLGVFHRKAHEVHLREALAWTGVWIALALLFNAGLWYWQGGTIALQFLTGYLIEKSLAVDNIFVFLMIFTYFAVPPAFQKRVLMIGIIGAIVLRTVMILVGSWLVSEFHWVLYLFGAFLLLTGLQIFNAHPALYIGDQSGFQFENHVLAIGAENTPDGPIGYTEILGAKFDTTGVLGLTGSSSLTLSPRGREVNLPRYPDVRVAPRNVPSPQPI